MDQTIKSTGQEKPIGAPAAWGEALEISMAQIAAGQSVPLEPALERLRASIARMEAKRAAG